MKKLILLLPIILLAGCTFQYNNIKSNELENSVSDEVLIENTEPEIDIYQFLSDTRDIYCKLREFADYANGLMDELREDVKNKQISKETEYESRYRGVGKNGLLKFEMLQLDDIFENYGNKYAEYPFIESINLINLWSNYGKKSVESMANYNKEDRRVYIEARNEAGESFKNALIKEYEVIRGNDESLWPLNESELLDISKWCSTDVDEESEENEQHEQHEQDE